MRVTLFVYALLSIIVTGLITTALPASAWAATDPTDFALQVSPSPLVTTVKPGVPTVLDLRIRNNGTSSEDLKIEPRDFKFDSHNGTITIDDTSNPPEAAWVTFGSPSFTVKSGDWFNEKVTIQVPKQAGFSYSFVLVLSRKNTPQPVSGGRLIKGSVAVLHWLMLIDPGSTRALQIPTFATSKHVYEYIPVDFTVAFRNSGNSIVQPYGNIFIQRGSNDKAPISTLKLNDKKAYILPSTTRIITANWSSGFPVYATSTDDDGASHTALRWDWNQASNFRIGKYTAKLVAVYNDGTRDVPIEQEVSFWVIPWKSIIVAAAVITGLILLANWRNKRRTDKAVRRALAAQSAAAATKADKS